MDWTSIIHGAASVLWLLAIPLITLIVLGGLFNAVTFSSISGCDRRWISVGPLFTLFLATFIAITLIWNSGMMASIVGRLAQFAGFFEALSFLHATSCMVLVIVTSVRAFFVVSEMDNGRYAGTDEIPSLVAQTRVTRFLEAFVRLAILVGLTLFTGAFLRIILPSGSLNIDLIGSPAIFADLKRTCIDYSVVVASQGVAVNIDSCIADEIAGLPINGESASLAQLSRQMVDPVKFFLMPSYVAMMIWCVIIWFSCKSRASPESKLGWSLTVQNAISVCAFLSTTVMVVWVDTAINQEIFGQSLQDGELRGWLGAMSVFGILASMASFITLLFRTFRHDINAISQLFIRWKRTLQGSS